jgi:predicted signal transduction protein with EAL and GGDEF domain
VYGTFCCFSHTPDQSLNERDIEMMQVFAELAARQTDKERAADAAYDEMRMRIQSVLSNDTLSMVYQPIYEVGRERIVGFEALSRFSAEPRRTPDLWYAEAARSRIAAARGVHFPECVAGNDHQWRARASAQAGAPRKDHAGNYRA